MYHLLFQPPGFQISICGVAASADSIQALPLAAPQAAKMQYGTPGGWNSTTIEPGGIQKWPEPTPEPEPKTDLGGELADLLSSVAADSNSDDDSNSDCGEAPAAEGFGRISASIEDVSADDEDPFAALASLLS